MNVDDLLNDPELRKATITFASGYAKRLMESQYDRAMKTKAAQMISQLPRPQKYAIEAALNGIVAYLATKEARFEGNPITAFLWEVGQDASSELSKRLLNGYHESANAATAPHGPPVGQLVQDEERSVVQGILQMNPQDLSAFLTWLQMATPGERKRMAESMSRLTEEEQAKLAALTPEQAKTLFASTAPSPPEPQEKRCKSLLSSLTDALRSVNNRIERRADK